ncbi:MAG: rhodanese-like domain-containing protein [Fimbriimonadaceae bacterium]|nr:rhodanese-like domain-containing protein [Fimbriimonadaceae bacterium]
MEKIAVESLAKRLESGDRLQLIDVRSPGEFAAGHIPGAVNMPMEEVEARVLDMHGHDPVVLVCQSGNRACMTFDVLSAQRDDLMVLEGGTSAWQQAGRSVIRTSRARWSLERQVRLAAGLLVLIGSLLAVLAAPGWVYLAMFVGAGLTFAGLTNICGMASLFAIMPWNRPAVPASGREVKA